MSVLEAYSVTPAQEIIKLEVEGDLLVASNEKPHWSFAPEDDELDEEE